MKWISWLLLMALLMAKTALAGEIVGTAGVNDYFKPSLQVWKIVSVASLAPANVPADLRGIPTILRGSYLIFGADFFARPSLNLWGSYGYAAACFKREEGAVMVSMHDARKSSPMENYRFVRSGGGYFYMLDNYFKVNIEPATLSSIKKQTLDEIQAGIPANKESSYGKVMCGFNSKVIRANSEGELSRNFFITAMKPARLEGNTYIYEPERRASERVVVKKPVKRCPLLSVANEKAGKEAFSKKLALSNRLSGLVEVQMASSLRGADGESACARNAVKTEEIQQELEELPMGNVVETYACFMSVMTALAEDNKKDGCKP